MNLRRFFAGIAMSLSCAISTSSAQQSPAADPASQELIGRQAVALVLKRYKIDPNNSVPKTGKPLRADGQWAVGKALPQSCPKTDDPCIRVLYRVPDLDITCEWTVLLRGSDDSNIVLNLKRTPHDILSSSPPTIKSSSKSSPGRFRYIHLSLAVRMYVVRSRCWRTSIRQDTWIGPR
jgi:hypothetical protein